MKYLLCALLLCGAFFSITGHAEETPAPLQCKPGETPLLNMGGCGQTAPENGCEIENIRWDRFNAPGYGTGIVSGKTIQPITNIIKSFDGEAPEGPCFHNETRVYFTTTTNTHNLSVSCSSESPRNVPFTITKTMNRKSVTGSSSSPLQCTRTDVDPYINTVSSFVTVTTKLTDEVKCPDSHPIGPVFYDDGQMIGNYCYYIPEPPCDDPLGNCDPDEPEPPEECGGPLNPCPSPPCAPGGNGMMVCKDNPDDKCDLVSAEIDENGNPQPVYANCQEGCGFILGSFFCATKPDDMPSFEKCKFTFNGYACPSEPNDNITDPEKPIQDMKKQDFKDTNIGVESRQDKTNDLLETLIATNITDAENLSKLQEEGNAGTGKSNNYLKDIDSNIKKVADDFGDFVKPGNDINPPPPEPESWYESEYENGIIGIWEERSAAIMQTPMFEFMEQFELTPAGTQPDWQMCFNLGALGNYGCEQLEIASGIWAFLKLCILITAAFLCRRIIFGG